jgi:hypothetical protein
MFAMIHRKRFFRKSFICCFCSRHSEALAEESIGVFFMFPGSFAFAQDDTSMANKIIAGIRKISELIKSKNRVKIRILPANARKNII